jgi:tRNA (cytosine38-C5)-methyltransferase
MKEATLPIMICCENVVGFEKSNSFERWQKVLADRKYHVGHFHLTPTQVDIPNDRPRYYCVAVQRSFLSDSDEAASLLGYLRYEEPENTNPATISTSIPELGVNSESSDNVKSLEALPTISSFLDQKVDESFRVPEKLLKTKAAWCFDIVSPNARRSR